MNPPIDLTGATVISIDQGARLMFVTKERIDDPEQMREFVGRLSAFLRDVEFQVVFGIDEVIVQGSEPDYPSDEAMAAIAAACTCADCMTGGRCVEDPPDDSDRDDEHECECCPSDCQICSGTPDCDCPTHGGPDAV